MRQHDERRLHLVRGFKRFSAQLSPPEGSAQPSGEQEFKPEPLNLGHRLTVEDLKLLVRSAENRVATLIEDRRRLGTRLEQIVTRSVYEIGTCFRPAQPDEELDLDKVKGSIDQAAGSVARLLQDLQEISLSLNSETVAAFDLASEFDVLMNSLRHTYSLHVKADLAQAAIEALTREEAHAVLRIVRDALTSCIHFARATAAEVILRKEGRLELRLLISDNGSRFVVGGEPYMGTDFMKTAGLARKLGWKLHVRRRRSRGTHITAVLPLEPMFLEE